MISFLHNAHLTHLFILNCRTLLLIAKYYPNNIQRDVILKLPSLSSLSQYVIFSLFMCNHHPVRCAFSQTFWKAALLTTVLPTVPELSKCKRKHIPLPIYQYIQRYIYINIFNHIYIHSYLSTCWQIYPFLTREIILCIFFRMIIYHKHLLNRVHFSFHTTRAVFNYESYIFTKENFV